MNNGLIREWLNGGLIPLNICIIFIIIFTLFRTYKVNGHGWSHTPGVQAACALLWIFIADLIRSTLAWTFLHSTQPKYFMSATATIMYIAAALMALLATLRLMYVLSPKAWGHKAWIGALLFSLVFIISAEFFHGFDWFQNWILNQP